MEGVFDFWQAFGDDTNFTEIVCDSEGSLAVAVLAYYNIPCQGLEGGDLLPLDIKHMDALEIIKFSLLEHSAKSGGVWEMVVSEAGDVDFINVGSFSGLSDCTIYHQIQSSTFLEKCSGVMITGAKPLVKRKPVEWVNIWDVGGWKEIYQTSWLSGNCLSNKYSQYAIIVFQDPHLVTGSAHNDGIDNLYETKSYWENIMGYARYITWEGAATSPETTVTRESNAIIPLLVSGGVNSTSYNASLGTLQSRPPMPASIEGVSPDCFSGKADESPSHEGGVKIAIPNKFRYETVRGTKVDKLNAVSDIIIVGRKIDNLKGIPASDSDAVIQNPKNENAKIEISVNESSDTMFKLEEGIHYVIAYEQSTEGSIPYVVFAENSREFEPADFGNDTAVKVSEDCVLYAEHGITSLEGSILPTGGTDGYLVKQVIALVDIQTPCIKIYDPRSAEGAFGKAHEIATTLEYKLAALVSVDEPAPVAFNGSSINMEQIQVDHDPTTQQNFQETDFEQAMDQMAGGGGVSLTLSFLDQGGCEKLSSELYEYMNMGNGSVVTYVCGPDSAPKLGGVGFDSNSIINEIVYSYADSNSYTISVSAGPRLVGGFTSVTGGVLSKKVESFPSSGTVVEDLGNHIHFKVLLDGYGSSPILAINTAPMIIRVGDKVQCTIYNNAVEE